MLWKLALVLTVVPLVELYLLVKITALTNFAFTVLLIVLTGLVGAILARMQGIRVVDRMFAEMSQGRVPADEMLDGAMVLVAAALLVTPGVLTDAVGFFLLTPPGRALTRKLIKAWARRRMSEGRMRVYKDMGFGPIRKEPPAGSPPLEEDEDQ